MTRYHMRAHPQAYEGTRIAVSRGRGSGGESVMKFQVSYACNDYRNGNFTGQCENIRIDHEKMHAIELYGPTRTVTEVMSGNKSHLRILRKKFPCTSFSEWVGNWCWNACWMSTFNMLRLLNALIQDGWQCEEGPSEIFDRINGRQEVRESDLNLAMKDVASA
jgi:hypothetical protein